MAGEPVELPQGYDGWTAPDDQSDEQLLEQYAEECRLATAAVDGLRLDAAPVWWFEDGGEPPGSSLQEGAPAPVGDRVTCRSRAPSHRAPGGLGRSRRRGRHERLAEVDVD